MYFVRAISLGILLGAIPVVNLQAASYKFILTEFAIPVEIHIFVFCFCFVLKPAGSQWQTHFHRFRHLGWNIFVHIFVFCFFCFKTCRQPVTNSFSQSSPSRLKSKARNICSALSFAESLNRKFVNVSKFIEIIVFCFDWHSCLYILVQQILHYSCTLKSTQSLLKLSKVSYKLINVLKFTCILLKVSYKVLKVLY